MGEVPVFGLVPLKVPIRKSVLARQQAGPAHVVWNAQQDTKIEQVCELRARRIHAFDDHDWSRLDHGGVRLEAPVERIPIERAVACRVPLTKRLDDRPLPTPIDAVTRALFGRIIADSRAAREKPSPSTSAAPKAFASRLASVDFPLPLRPSMATQNGRSAPPDRASMCLISELRSSARSWVGQRVAGWVAVTERSLSHALA